MNFCKYLISMWEVFFEMKRKLDNGKNLIFCIMRQGLTLFRSLTTIFCSVYWKLSVTLLTCLQKICKQNWSSSQNPRLLTKFSPNLLRIMSPCIIWEKMPKRFWSPRYFCLENLKPFCRKNRKSLLNYCQFITDRVQDIDVKFWPGLERIMRF